MDGWVGGHDQVLANLADVEKSAYFYLRDPYYVESVPAAERAIYESEGPYEQGKLTALKLDITQSSFPARQYQRPSQMAEFLYEDIRDLINQRYPPGSALGVLDSERFRNNSYARSLTQVRATPFLLFYIACGACVARFLRS